MKLQKNKLSQVLPVTLAIGALSLPVQAAITINISESGGNVVAEYSGTIDLSATLGSAGSATASSGNWFGDENGGLTFAAPGSIGSAAVDGYEWDLTLPLMGLDLVADVLWTTNTGDPFQMYGNGELVALPSMYASGSYQHSYYAVGYRYL